MGDDRYNAELRRKRLEMRRRQIRLRFTIFLASVVLVIAVIVSLSVWGIKRHTSKKELAAGMEAVQACYTEFMGKHKAAVEASAPVGEKASTSFASWFMNAYPKHRDAILKKARSGKLTADDIYGLVGESMYVVYDRYRGYLDNAETARKHGIYMKNGKNGSPAEVLIAGDLCLAEDGFVLDHYDTVNDLSKCISPKILKMTNAADVFYLNHEYVISDRGEPLQGKLYTFRAKPERMELLKEMGTDLVSLANNHVYDYGKDAMLDTMKLLDKAKIAYVGGGRNLKEAERPIYYVINGIKIGFVAATNAELVYYTPAATKDSPGVLEAYDTTEYDKVIKEASGQCDYLIAYIHWGPEDTNTHTQEQHDMGKEFLESGADIVVGGHPHVLQGAEYIGGKPIVYSMGDFWFNDETKYTGLLKLDINAKGLKEMSFVPCLQTGYTTQYISDKGKQKEFYDFFNNLSPNAKLNKKGRRVQ